MGYRAVAFDLDGTLIESGTDDLEWLYEAIRKSLGEFDCEKEARELPERHLGKLAGIDGYDDYLRLCEQVGVDPRRFWEQVSHNRAKAKLGIVEQGRLGEREGATQLLESLEDSKLGVVSNAPEQSVEGVVEELGWGELLDFACGITDLADLTKRKPRPHHIRLAEEELGSKGLYVGDSAADVRAAERAGWDSVHLTRGGDGKASFSVDELSGIEDIVREG